MYRLLLFVCGVTLASLLATTAFAQEQAAPLSVPAAPAADAYGYMADDVAVGQGIVLYWYAHGYANAFGNLPANYAELTAKGLPLRKFMSPHTGAEIMPDDGTLDFDGDMTYKGADCGDVTIQVQTTKGVITLPGTVTAASDIRVQFDPCCCPDLCGECVEIRICDIDCWNLCDTEAICKIVQWIMWKSFETHEDLYGMRPANEMAWMASGLAPIDANYKELAPTMDIEYIYSKGHGCCFLKKAKVNCCEPCVKCSPCKSVCRPENPCGKCNKCERKCDSCKPRCEEKTCSKCDTCRPKCENKCNTCNKCKQKSCTKCERKCDTCERKCDTCKPKCNTCKPKCDTCKPKCNTCDKCKQKTCTKCEKKCDSCEKPRCSKCH